MEKTYDPQSIEKSIYEAWEANGDFAPAEDKGQEHFSIMLPPPNVTGSLHMGHAFQNAIMDILIRFQRMDGKRTLWMPGTDHAGIATQIVVERQLEAQGTSREELGREEFMKRVWDWKGESGGTFTKQMRRLGASLDWSKERFTMDEGLSNAVQEVFIQLYREDLIYRGKRLVNWDPKLNTSVSDLEVINHEEQGSLWHFKYPVSAPKAGQPTHLTVATTRPETIFGDAAIAVHPEDERYKDMIGTMVQLPMCDREIPIIADDYVDPAFGTGCVKITPAHDFNDYEVGQRHDLPQIEIMNLDATINTNAPAKFQGMDRYVAREAVVAEMESLGLLDKVEPHGLKTPRGERTGVAIEPMLTNQWFVRADVLAEPAIKAVEDGDIKFVPQNWENTYFSWMRNIQDWCISRQLWWGHRIPAWYDDQGNAYVGKDEAEVRAHYKLADDLALRQEEDVLDTWFSSALWTFSTLGWPEETDDLQKFHPSSVLVTGFDIIFFWVARMIMMTMKFRKQIPFHTIYMHGLIRDSEGQKMSKSKGNVLDPIDLIDGIGLEELVAKRTANLMNPKMAKAIEKATRKEFPEGINAYGTDALRFTFCALASQGRDIRFDLNRIEGYRNFCNKLWNATRFVHMTSVDNLEKPFDADHVNALKDNTNLADRWILNQLQETIEKAHTALSTYRFDLLAQTLYQFAWNEFCDWYLELAKITLYAKPKEGDTEETIAAMQAQKVKTQHTAVYVLEQLVRLLHPIMPYITTSIWDTLKAPLSIDASEKLIHAAYPHANEELKDAKSAAAINWTQEVITGIRAIRGEMSIPMSKKIPLLLSNGTAEDRDLAATAKTLITPLAQLESMDWLEAGAEVPPSATHVVGELQVLVPLAGLIDVEEERTRLNKNIEKISKELQKAQAQMQNERFMAKAPEAVVQGVKDTIEDASKKLQGYQDQLEKLKDL